MTTYSKSSRVLRRGCTALALGFLVAGCIGDGTGDGDSSSDGDGDGTPAAQSAGKEAEGSVNTVTVLTDRGPEEMTYKIVGGERIVEGDIVLPAADGPDLKAAISTRSRWTNGRVPYEIRADLTGQQRVHDAITHYQRFTNVRLVPRNGESDYIRFVPGGNCQSPVGRAGGAQSIVLAAGCSTGTVIHEIGHSLGLWHEQSRSDRDNHVVIHWANIEAGEGHNFEKQSSTAFGAYDFGSIMHYDSSAFSANGLSTITRLDGTVINSNRTALSDGDRRAFDSMYPTHRGPLPAVCRTAPVRPTQRPLRADLSEIWQDVGGLASFALSPSIGTAFAAPRAWGTRDGGWSIGVRWAAGDFDNDGDQDLVGVWNDAGSNTLTVRRANGSSFSHEHWAIRQGGWMDSTQWLPGDFDGNGTTDLAGVWNDGGQVSIAVFRSTGSSFLPHTQWTVRNGTWNDSVRWTVGNFNGDAFDDIVGVWNDGGSNTLTVRPSNGSSSFGHEHWAVRQGTWASTTQWVAGDYDRNGLTDLAAIWKDGAMTSIAVYPTTGSGFAERRQWATRDGGWANDTKWVSGDFNADGYGDLAAIWNDGGMSTLTVRRSTGSALVQEHWAIRTAGWQDATPWCAGTFDWQ